MYNDMITIHRIKMLKEGIKDVTDVIEDTCSILNVKEPLNEKQIVAIKEYLEDVKSFLSWLNQQ